MRVVLKWMGAVGLPVDPRPATGVDAAEQLKKVVRVLAFSDNLDA